jgi:uncharacterized protein YbaR (Trm112 family)
MYAARRIGRLAMAPTNLDAFLLEVLVCPSTRQKVALAADEAVAALNEKIRKGEVKDVSGAAVAQPLDGLLVRDDGLVGYPVRDDIPEMLVDRGIEIGGAK